jgi:hypothetical protein
VDLGVLNELEAAGLVTLADKGYQGATHAKIPYRGKNKPESQKQANRAHARLRAPGERANAQLKTWRILRKLRCCPWRAGQLAKAIHALEIHAAKQDGKGSVISVANVARISLARALCCRGPSSHTPPRTN